MPFRAGTRLGAYEIVEPIGAGGMGEVYRARDARLERDVAIKVLPARLAGDPGALTRFEREAKAVAALSHPSILAIFDFGLDAGVAYAVTELLAGETLRDRLARGPLAVRKSVEYAIQIAEGLGAAHEKGIVHRDLKPENLFLTNDGRVKILDFGLARQTVVAGSEDTGSPTLSRHTEPGPTARPRSASVRERRWPSRLTLLYRGPDGFGLVPIEGGEPRKGAGLESEDRPIRWSADGSSIFVDRDQRITTQVFRVELADGRRTLLWEVGARDPAGAHSPFVSVTADGKAYAYSFVRNLGDLYLVDGLR